MRPQISFRTASVLSLLFAAAHTYGFLALRPSTREAIAVRSAMDSVHFAIGSRLYSFGGFYVGFGFFISCAFVLLGWLSWVLGGLSRTTPAAVPSIGWPMVAFLVASLGVALKWFSVVPALLSAVIGLCLAWGTWASARKSNTRISA